MPDFGRRENAKWGVLKSVANYVKSEGTLGMPRASLRDFDEAVEGLIRDGALISDGTEVRFFHESLFDHVLARSWAEGDTDLVRSVLATNQDLSHRSLVRQVLVYQRGTHHAAYVRSVKDLLYHPKIRFHLKDVAISVLRSDSAPTQELWDVIAPLAESFGEVGQMAIAEVLTEPAWFRCADYVGAILRWAVSEDPRYQELAAGLLGAAQRTDPDRSAMILAALAPLDSWRPRLRWLVLGTDVGQSVASLQLITWALEAGLFDDGNRFVDDAFLYALGRGKTSYPWMVPKVLEALVDRWFSLANNGDRLSDVVGRDHALSAFLSAVAEAQPAAYVSKVLPRVLETLHRSAREERTSIWEGPWAIRHVSTRDDAADTLFVALGASLAWLARNDEGEFEAASQELVTLMPTHGGRHLLFRSWTASPKRYAEEALRELIAWDAPFECGYVDSPYWVTRELIAAIHPHLRPVGRRTLETLILDYYPAWERSHRGRLSRGRAQYVLLDGLESIRMSEQARRRREELRRKFGDEVIPPRPISAGFVPSPIPEQAAAKMSDTQWLGALRRYASDEDRDWLKGGPHQLSSVLQSEARKDPRRFARFARRLPSDVNEAYPSAILIGIADSVTEDDAELVFDAIRHIYSLEGHPSGRWVGKPLARLADVEIPQDILSIVRWYAENDRDPESDVWVGEEPYYGGDPLTAGINSVRGAAAEAISALIWPRPERVLGFAEALRSLCSDPTGAVRSCAALAVLSVSRHDEALGLRLFKDLVADIDDRVLATRYVENCLSKFGANQRAGLVPLVRRLLRSEHPAAREVGGRQAAIMSLERGPLEALMRTALRAGAEARKGVAQVAAAYMPDEESREQCINWLFELFDDDHEEVRQAAAEWVNRSSEGELQDGELLSRFVRSAAFREDPSALLTRLDESTRIGADTLLLAVEEVVAHRYSDLADMRTHLSGDVDLVAKLAIRAYASASELQTRRRALDLIDRLMALRGSPMRRVVADYE